MGTLDATSSSVVKRYSKIIDIDGMTRPQVKAALDSTERVRTIEL